MDKKKKADEFYKRLEAELEKDTRWPSVYLFKFIIPASLEKTAKIEEIFDGTKAEIETRDSAKGNYTSVSIRVIMESPASVIEKYKEVSTVEGVISL